MERKELTPRAESEMTPSTKAQKGPMRSPNTKSLVCIHHTPWAHTGEQEKIKQHRLARLLVRASGSSRGLTLSFEKPEVEH